MRTHRMAGWGAVVLAAALATGMGPAWAGPVGGPQTTAERVQPLTTDVYTIVFQAGQTAIVTVAGDGGTDLDLYVYDENGNLVASDTDRTDQCVATFTPKWTGPFVIRVRNWGLRTNSYGIFAG